MFLFVIHKPRSVDSYRGANKVYPEEFATNNMLTDEELVDVWAEYLYKNLTQNEDGYEFYIYKDGVQVWDECGSTWDGIPLYPNAPLGVLLEAERCARQEIEDIRRKAQAIAEAKKKAKEDEEAAKALAEKQRAEAMEKEQRRQEFEKLKKEFGQ